MDFQKIQFKAILFFALAVLCLLPFIQPAVALILGITFSLSLGNPCSECSAVWSKRLLKISVVGLGFGLSIQSVIQTGIQAAGYTFAGIALTFILGHFLRVVFKTEAKTTFLITAGTAICGGSAIAAVAPVVKAQSSQIAVAIATVFLLNGLALLVFPFIGTYLNMSEEAFGVWSAIAIHDTSSVVGAAAVYGTKALEIGVTFKLTRAFWILPLTFIIGLFNSREGKASFPLFLIGFLCTALLSSLIPQWAPLWQWITLASKQLLTVCLFLVGSSVTRELLKNVGLRPLMLATLLWVLISVCSLWAIQSGWMDSLL